MRARAIAAAWNRFFFEPQSPLNIGLFRILYGALVVATLLLSRADWLDWYGVHSWVSLETMHRYEPGTRINLFLLLPQSDAWVEGLFWLFLAAAVLFTIGFGTRVMSVVVFVCLASVQQRNLYILHGGDTFLRVTGFFLVFAPAGAALSVDRWIRVRRGYEGAELRPCSPWAQRMIQIELSLLYLAAFCSKVQGEAWVNGTALGYVYHVDELRRFPAPGWFLTPWILRLATWGALTMEFSLGVLIWLREVRYYVLACGVVMHLFIEYSLNIPLFEWDVMAAYVLFVDGDDLRRAGRFGENIARRVRGRMISYRLLKHSDRNSGD